MTEDEVTKEANRLLNDDITRKFPAEQDVLDRAREILRTGGINGAAVKAFERIAEGVVTHCSECGNNAEDLAIVRGHLPLWISVGDRLPESDEHCDVWCLATAYDSEAEMWETEVAVYFTNDQFWADSNTSNDALRFTPTHWMPLPEPPK